MCQRNMRSYAKQVILQSFAKSRVHCEGNHERANACGDSYHAEHSDQPQNGRAIWRTKISLRDKPFDGHCSDRLRLGTARFRVPLSLPSLVLVPRAAIAEKG